MEKRGQTTFLGNYKNRDLSPFPTHFPPISHMVERELDHLEELIAARQEAKT
jgi:hypothetical protein